MMLDKLKNLAFSVKLRSCQELTDLSLEIISILPRKEFQTKSRDTKDRKPRITGIHL